MDEADVKPASNKVCLGGNDQIQEHAIGLATLGSLRVMAADDIVCEEAQPLHILPGGEKLKCADPDMARGHPCEDCPGEKRLAGNRLSGQHCGERTRCWDSKGRHRLAEEVLAQNRPQGRAPIATA